MSRARPASRARAASDPAENAANRISTATVSGRIAIEACLASSNECRPARLLMKRPYRNVIRGRMAWMLSAVPAKQSSMSGVSQRGRGCLSPGGAE